MKKALSKDPLVSVIVPTFNSANFIYDAIKSVLNQTYENWEMIITDDCSTDETIEIVEDFALKDKRIKSFRLKENAGPGVSRNNSIMYAKGSFIAFLDSDDLWLPKKLQTQLNFMLEMGYPFTYTSYRGIDENGILNSNLVTAKKRICLSDMLKSNYVGCSTAIYNAGILGKQFMPEMRKRQDYGLWFKLIKELTFAYGLDEVLTLYRQRNDSLSGSKFKLIKYQWKLYRDVFELNRASSIRSFFFWGLYALTKQKNKGF